MAESAVDLRELEPGIVLITMQDRIHKNTFSEELVTGLKRAYATIAQQARTKVVILTGYDSYFATGGTKEELLALQEGRLTFTDLDIYSLALNCKIPVIAAMQGHGIGGGLVMGLYADFILLSRESIYSTNFMKYGFTPGMGATYIVPKKLGVGLGNEMLLNAQTYRGEELGLRGAPFPVYPRKDVLNQACRTARQLVEKPRDALITLKDHLVAPLRTELPLFIENEVRMHKQTFHREEVKTRIRTLF